MDRRNFLKQTTLVSIGGLLIPSTLFSACRKETLLEDLKYDGKVLIIGAGVAGLYAAYILKSKGIDFQILEAGTNYGGRVGKLENFANFPIDTGAQWLHGKNNVLGDLIKKSVTTITLDDSDEKFWFNNQLIDTLPKDLIKVFENEKDIPDLSFKDYAIQQGFGDEYNNIVENIAGDSGADASSISAYWKVQEEENWISGSEDFKFQETYFDFIDKQIASQVKDKV